MTENATVQPSVESDVEADKVLLVSGDQKTFEVARKAAKRLNTVKVMMDDLVDVSTGIPLTNVTGSVLAKVLEHANHYCDQPPPPEKVEEKKDLDSWSSTKKELPEIPEWDKTFMEVDQAMLYDLILASNYLDYKELLELSCRTMAGMIAGKKADEIRKTFNIQCDFTEKELEQIRIDSQWAFE